MEQIAEKIFRFLCSLKLAVIIIVSLGTIAAVGTIMESKYDANTAQKLVYQSPYMYTVLILLCINLIAVMIDRLPWKKRHTGFVLAHIGIITLLVGSYITHKMGLDGTVSFEIGESTRYVTTHETEVLIYKINDLENSQQIFSQNVDFMVDSPKKNPLKIPVGQDQIVIDDYMPYAHKDFHIDPSDKVTDGPALRFQLQNSFVNMVEWLVQSGTSPAKMNLGPAQVVLEREGQKYITPGGQNEVVVYPTKSPSQLKYEVYGKEGKILNKGTLPVGGVFTLPWMQMSFRAVQFLPKAQVQYTYTPMEHPNASSSSAVQVEFQGKKYWLGLDTALQLYTKDSVYFVTYADKRVDLGFEMTLDRFDMEKYQGTDMAKSYKSIVNVSGRIGEKPLGEAEISMNKPLKSHGYTFYQSSFEQDRMGKPTASILSVNYDPGRPLKYIGSFLIIFGAIMLFYFKKFGRTNDSQKTNEVTK